MNTHCNDVNPCNKGKPIANFISEFVKDKDNAKTLKPETDEVIVESISSSNNKNSIKNNLSEHFYD